MFETPLFVDTLPDFALLNPVLAAAVRDRRRHDPGGMKRSNREGWHSDTAMLDWGGPAFRTLIEHVVALANLNSIDVRRPETPRYAWKADAWANISTRGSANQLHCHVGAYWSAVYYVDDGYAGSADRALGGELAIEDPRMPMLLMEEPDLRIRPLPDTPLPEPEQRIRPVSGKLLMFPGWLRHAVTPYRGDGERISIAINLTVCPKAP